MNCNSFFLSLVTIFILNNSANAADRATASTNLFHSPTAGFTIVKPAAWQFASLEQVNANRAIARFKDKDLEKQARERTDARLVAILKYPEPYEGLNPSAQVLIKPLGQLEGKTAVEILQFAVGINQRAMTDFTVVEPIQEIKIGDMSAAYLKATYTVVHPGGREFKVLSRMWVVPRGSFMFQIGMSGPAKGPDVSEKEFKAILDSIKIDTLATDTNLFHSPTAGFTIMKPTTWQFGSMEQVEAKRANGGFKDKDFEKQVRERANAPLVLIMKHSEPQDDGVNPTAQVGVRPLGQLEGKTAIELLELTATPLQRAMAEFTFVERIQEAKVAGISAAYMKAKYTMVNSEGREFKVLSRMWIVPRNSFVYIIGMSGPQEGPDVSEKEFRTILDSIKIEQ